MSVGDVEEGRRILAPVLGGLGSDVAAITMLALMHIAGSWPLAARTPGTPLVTKGEPARLLQAAWTLPARSRLACAALFTWNCKGAGLNLQRLPQYYLHQTSAAGWALPFKPKSFLFNRQLLDKAFKYFMNKSQQKKEPVHRQFSPDCPGPLGARLGNKHQQLSQTRKNYVFCWPTVHEAGSGLQYRVYWRCHVSLGSPELTGASCAAVRQIAALAHLTVSHSGEQLTCTYPSLGSRNLPLGSRQQCLRLFLGLSSVTRAKTPAAS
jgi:hypothetical protein